MKTLKTLLALALLVSAVAPVCAMNVQEPVAPVAAPVAPAPVADEAPAAAAAQEAAPEAPKATFFAKAKETASNGAEAVKNFYAWNPEAKAVSIAKYGVTAAAVAAVVGGLVYLLTSEDEVETTEEAPVVETPVKTTPEVAPVAPVAPVVAPVVKPGMTTKQRVAAREVPRGKRGFRCALQRKARSSKSSKSSCKSSKSSCKPCQA